MTKKYRNYLKYSLIVLIFFIISIAITVYFDCHWATDYKFKKDLNKVDQNATHYIKNNTGINIYISQKKIKIAYLKHYFSPWDLKKLSLKRVKEIERNLIKNFSNSPGWGRNRQKNNKEWINHIKSNMNEFKKWNKSKKGIMIRDVNVRLLPTKDPSFNDWKQAGEGYPFDYIQVSYIYADTPITILNISNDHLWYLIQDESYIGWVPSNSVAFVSDDFIQKWKSSEYVIVTKNNFTASNNYSYAIQTHMGVLYPLKKETPKRYIIFSVKRSKKNRAVIITAYIDKLIGKKFPLKLTTQNIAMIANNLLGSPYAWGNMDGHEDCSGMIQDLFSSFGLSLPKNSKDQIDSMKALSIPDRNKQTKERFIISHGIPFLTLLYQPGHIMLYIGEKHGKAYTIQNKWGLVTHNVFGKKGRAVIGKTVIIPLSFGNKYMNVFKTNLDKVTKMATLITPPTYSVAN